jgi:hypothetical protein
MSSTSTHTDIATAGADTPLLDRWSERYGRPAIVAATVVAAVVANTVIWAVGALASGSFEYTDGGATQSAAPGGVIVLTAVPVAVGMALAALLAPRWPVLVRVAQVVGPLASLLTIGGTISADFDGPSTVALSLAHVAIVPALLVGLEVVHRRVTGRPCYLRPGPGFGRLVRKGVASSRTPLWSVTHVEDGVAARPARTAGPKRSRVACTPTTSERGPATATGGVAPLRSANPSAQEPP